MLRATTLELHIGREPGLELAHHRHEADQFTGAAKTSSRNVVLWDFCDTWRIFLPDHIAGRFSCSNVTIRTRRGACAWVSRPRAAGMRALVLVLISVPCSPPGTDKIQSTTDAGSLNTFGRNEIEVAPISSALLRMGV